MQTDVTVERKNAPACEMIKLSEAMRLGAKLRPQCREVFFGDGGSCALGAIYEGLTGEIGKDLFDMRIVFRRLPDGMLRKIADRNDAGESRESIADWLEAQGL